MRQFDIDERGRSIEHVLVEMRVDRRIDPLFVRFGRRYRYDFRHRGAGLHMECELAVAMDHADVGDERAG